MRSLWKGHLRLSLVTIPIRVFPATNSAADISFHQLHRECQSRIQYKKWCPACDREVTKEEIVKGYEFEKGRYVALEEADTVAFHGRERLVAIEPKDNGMVMGGFEQS